MEKIFGQIYDFQYRRADKLENSSYLEELTGLLANETKYFFGDAYYLKSHTGEPNSSFRYFIEDLKNSFYNSSGSKINIIRGRAGIGKSLFFEKGIQRLVRIDKGHNDNYIYMGVDFKNIDNDKDIKFYEEWIFNKIFVNAIDAIRPLGEEVYENFKKEYEKFDTTFHTPNTSLFPLKYFCEKISKKYDRPCIIVFDNIDLASVKTQKNVFDATVNICNTFNAFMRQNKLEDCYRVYFVMRPETHLRYNEGKLGNVINFPLPNVLKITLAIVKKVLDETAEEFDNKRKLPCNVSCADVIGNEEEMISLTTFKEVAKYFYRILDHYLENIWDRNSSICDRLGTSEEFHCNIVNYNVRMFVRFFADTISNGGFKPLTKEFNQRQGVKNYNTYDYVEMIIRGRWPVHPGNEHIDGEGGNKAPIVYNVFDTSLYGHNYRDKIKHFMLNIRILQYFFLCAGNHEVVYENIKTDLADFFDEKYICHAIKKLIYIHLLYSYEEGDAAIASAQNWKEVSLSAATPLKLSPAGRFYLEHLICEFEYLYQMAMTSLMEEEYIKEIGNGWKTEKEKTVLCFLKSMFSIIKINIRSYNSEQLVPFKSLFYYIDDPHGSKPFRRMLNRFISVISNKLQRAQKLETGGISKLETILAEAKELEEKVNQYFRSVLED